MEDSPTMKHSLNFRDRQSISTMGQEPFKLEIKFVILSGASPRQFSWEGTGLRADGGPYQNMGMNGATQIIWVESDGALGMS